MGEDEHGVVGFEPCFEGGIVLVFGIDKGVVLWGEAADHGADGRLVDADFIVTNCADSDAAGPIFDF